MQSDKTSADTQIPSPVLADDTCPNVEVGVEDELKGKRARPSDSLSFRALSGMPQQDKITVSMGIGGYIS